MNRSTMVGTLATVCLAAWTPAATAQAPGTDAYLDAVGRAQASARTRGWEASARHWEHVVALNPVNGRNWNQLAPARFRAGDFDGAIEALERERALGSRHPWEILYDVARAHGRAGRHDDALRVLEAAFADGHRRPAQVRADPSFRSLRANPRFASLVGQVDRDTLSRDAGWRFDLHYLAREVRRIHDDPFGVTSEGDFQARVDELDREIPRLSDHHVAVRLMALMRLVGDGHTNIRPAFMGGAAAVALPLSFYLFEEGMVVTGVHPGYDSLLGTQVVAIGGHPVEDVVARVGSLVSRDNDMWIKHVAPGLLRFPGVLYGLDLTPDPARVALTRRDRDGGRRTLEVPAGFGRPDDSWLTISGTLPEPPLYLRNRSANYWFEYLGDEALVYVQYNAVQDAPGESIAAFADRLFDFIGVHEVDALVIDMRWNGGGNLMLNHPLVHGIIRSDKINQQDKLLVITRRNTFSAAQHGVGQLDYHTNAIFVGEPTGSRPQFVGETVRIALPYSGMRGSISDLYWQNTLAMDYRTWIPPTLYAPPTFAALRSGRDPALDAIRAYRSRMREPSGSGIRDP